MTHRTLHPRPRVESAARSRPLAPRDSVLVACPDARSPAYQAAIGLAARDQLAAFLTGYYDRGDGVLRKVARRVLDGGRYRRLERMLGRRHHPDLPGDRVRSTYAFDAALAVERRLPDDRRGIRRAVVRWRTERFDRRIASDLERLRPEVALLFSDVGSEHALPTCRRLGIRSILSMVHGDVRDERRVLESEARRCPEAFGLYLGDAELDREELDWLHARRLRDLEFADLVLVPSEQIAASLRRHGTDEDRIRVVPYAADTERFRPRTAARSDEGCLFLFAGGICQRKGIVDLLRAWRAIRRPGWRLQLLGAAPRSLGPLSDLLDGVELLGRVPHAEVPEVMAAADVFVFPSLFEGSAVVTYEALACGLPSVVTPSSGSVVRDGIDGMIVPDADDAALASAMERLGRDPALRARMAAHARSRAEQFPWSRYHRAVSEAVARVAPYGAGGRLGAG